MMMHYLLEVLPYFTDMLVTVSLGQSQYLRTNENSSPLSLSITKSDVTTMDVIVEVTVTDGTAIGKHMLVHNIEHFNYVPLQCIQLGWIIM